MADNSFPGLFVSIWGFFGLAIIHFIDGMIGYSARCPPYDKSVIKNHKFLWLVSRIEWTEQTVPSRWYLLYLLAPGLISCLCTIAIGSLVPNELVASILLFFIAATWFISSWIFNDFLSQVYIVSAGFFVILIILRLILLDDFVALGYGFDTLFASFITLWGIIVVFYLTYLVMKFPPLSQSRSQRTLFRGNALQIVVVITWSFVLFLALFPKDLFN